MKVTVNAEQFSFGEFEKDGKERHYARIKGRTTEGRKITALLWDAHAKAIDREFGNLIAPGVEFKDMHFLVEMDGREKPGKLRTSQTTGREYREQNFHVDRFQILTGPALELHRLRIEAQSKLEAVKAAVEAGTPEAALDDLQGFLSKIAYPEEVLSEDDMAAEIQDASDETHDHAAEVSEASNEVGAEQTGAEEQADVAETSHETGVVAEETIEPDVQVDSEVETEASADATVSEEPASEASTPETGTPETDISEATESKAPDADKQQPATPTKPRGPRGFGAARKPFGGPRGVKTSGKASGSAPGNAPAAKTETENSEASSEAKADDEKTATTPSGPSSRRPSMMNVSKLPQESPEDAAARDMGIETTADAPQADPDFERVEPAKETKAESKPARKPTPVGGAPARPKAFASPFGMKK